MKWLSHLKQSERQFIIDQANRALLDRHKREWEKSSYPSNLSFSTMSLNDNQWPHRRCWRVAVDNGKGKNIYETWWFKSADEEWRQIVFWMTKFHEIVNSEKRHKGRFVALWTPKTHEIIWC